MERIIDKSAILAMFQKKNIRTYYDVPEEFRNDKEIIAIQRQLKHRISNLRGYDIINNEFFVEESVASNKEGRQYFYQNKKTVFATFDEYYSFLDGDIYENAYYYQFMFTDELINKYKINFEKLNLTIKLDSTINNVKSNLSERRYKYKEAKKKLEERRSWIEKFNSATVYEDFRMVLREYHKKHSYQDVNFYIWNYLDKHGEDSFDVITKVLSDRTIHDELVKAMCFIYDIDKLKATFRYSGNGAQSTKVKYNANFKHFAEFVKTTEFTKQQKIYFDASTNYYCINTELFEKSARLPTTSIKKYIETIEELGEYLNYDFSDCDFTDAFELPEEKILKFNDNTKFPIKSEAQLNRIVLSGYDRARNRFYVKINFYSKTQVLYYLTEKEFKYFFEFVSFLNYDLTDSILIFCDGLKNVVDHSNLNIENARIVSSAKEKFGFLKESSIIKIEAKNFDNTNGNEPETSLVLQNSRNELAETEEFINDRKIYYITDLHLEHRLNYANCKTKEDCIYEIGKIIDNFFAEITTKLWEKDLLLIGGDTASTFWIFELFVKMLRNSIKERGLSLKVIFTLGNHELWEFPSCGLEAIVNKYRVLLEEHEMYLLQNEVICVFDDGIEAFSSEMKKSRIKQTRAILFGGIGFSGCNEEFNANNGFYRETISRRVEIEESEKIKKAYYRLCDALSQQQVIVLTHMPFEDWCGKEKRHENYIYISGHNHRNEYYDDGVIRVYSDNQIGYSKVKPRLKYFYFSYEFDLFEDYEDGIYKITREEYCDFYRGKRIYCNCNCVNEIFMLKKNGYYCFIHKNKLKVKSVEYYYDNMEKVLSMLADPFEKYSSAQRQISSLVKKIGGSGEIHGAIIDIDCLNHIYLNPIDLTATPYFAFSIINKIVYPSLEMLLEDNCPECYKKYKALLNDGRTELVLKTNTQLLKAPARYLNTDIYKASREIKKMQKLNSNILSVWFDDSNEKQLEE